MKTMKTLFTSLIVSLISLASVAQTNEYYQTMGESLGQYASCRTIDDFQALGNRFAMIARAEPDQWLPLYYNAHCYILMSFMEQSDAAKKDTYLDVAEKSVNRLLEMAPKEAEVYALQAMFCSARLLVNPMERGQKYGMLSAQAIGTALAIDPTNPRARLIQLQNNIGSAQFYGKDPKEYCDQAKSLLAEWDNFKPESPLHPAWGKQQLAGIVASCN